MDVKNEKLLDLLTNAKSSMNNMKVAISEKDKIEKSVEIIRKELTKINTTLKKIDESISEEEKNIGIYEEELRNIQFEFLKNDTDKIRSIVESNLPNTVTCKEVNSNLLKLYRKPTTENKTNRDTDKPQSIGTISIKEKESNENVVIINVDDKDRDIKLKQEFTISNPLKIYKIIAYINTNLHYDDK
jgi:hypothetical protein